MTPHGFLRIRKCFNSLTQFRCPALDVSEEKGIGSSIIKYPATNFTRWRKRSHRESQWLHQHHFQVCESKLREKVNSISAENNANTKNTMSLLRVSRPRKTTLQNHKHIKRHFMNGWKRWCCCTTQIDQTPQDWQAHLQMLCHKDMHTYKLQLFTCSLPWFYVQKRYESNTLQTLLT